MVRMGRNEFWHMFLWMLLVELNLYTAKYIIGNQSLWDILVGSLYCRSNSHHPLDLKTNFGVLNFLSSDLTFWGPIFGSQNNQSTFLLAVLIVFLDLWFRILATSRWWFALFFSFIPIWGNDPIWQWYVSDGLVQPPTRQYIPPYHISVYHISYIYVLLVSFKVVSWVCLLC